MMLRRLWQALRLGRRAPPEAPAGEAALRGPDGGGIVARSRQALFEQGIAAAARGDHETAAGCFERLTAMHPRDAEAWNALGNVAKLQGRLEQAAAHYRRALGIEPDAADVWANLGLCLRDDGRTVEALAALGRALELAPGHVDAAVSRAAALSDCGRFDEAAAELRRLLSAHPDLAQAHALLGQIHLLSGRFAEGWEEYEWRWRLPGAERHEPLPIAQWNGSPAPGALLLIRAEQALGDQIMLASCVADAAARVRTVWLECEPRLASLFARSFPGVRVFPRLAGGSPAWAGEETLPDLQIPIGALPRLFRRSRGDFPLGGAAYLRADPARVARWRARLDALGAGPKIGVSWRGGAVATRQNLRSIPLQSWSPIIGRGNAAFVSLQYGRCDEELSELRTGPDGAIVRHFPDAIADYEETAALVAALDLVISVQTAVVHLAGALGRPVWVMVSGAPEWRYLAAGDRLPWYASVRLFRQERLGEWGPVIAQVADRISAELG